MKIGQNHSSQATSHSRSTGGAKGPDRTGSQDDPKSGGAGDRADVSEIIKETMSHLKDRQPLQALISNIQGNFSQQ